MAEVFAVVFGMIRDHAQLAWGWLLIASVIAFLFLVGEEGEP